MARGGGGELEEEEQWRIMVVIMGEEGVAARKGERGALPLPRGAVYTGVAALISQLDLRV